MKIRKKNIVLKKIQNLILLIFNYLDNNNNADIRTNGELKFLADFLSSYADKELVIYDIGANAGDYTQILLKTAEKLNVHLNVHLFEPMPKTFEKLEERFMNKNGIILNNLACSENNGMAEIYFDQEQSQLASLYKRIAVELDQKTLIKLIRIEDYLTEKNQKKINLVKLDVEGHELSVLKGFGKFLSSEFIDFIQFEYGGTYIDSHTYLFDVVKLLQDKGFSIYKMKRNFLEPFSYIPEMENFAYSNFVAISPQRL